MSLNKIERRERIKMRIRKIVSGTPAQPRMTVYRSNKQIYVQFIDDLAGVTLATASSLDKEVAEAAAGKNKCEVAALVGKLAAERAVAKGISAVAFDRNGSVANGTVNNLVIDNGMQCFGNDVFVNLCNHKLDNRTFTGKTVSSLFRKSGRVELLQGESCGLKACKRDWFPGFTDTVQRYSFFE